MGAKTARDCAKAHKIDSAEQNITLDFSSFGDYQNSLLSSTIGALYTNRILDALISVDEIVAL